MEKSRAIGLTRKRDNTSDALNARRNVERRSCPDTSLTKITKKKIEAAKNEEKDEEIVAVPNLDLFCSSESLYFNDDNDYSQWVHPCDFESEGEDEVADMEQPEEHESSGASTLTHKWDRLCSYDVSDSDEEYRRQTHGSFILGKIGLCLSNCDRFIKDNTGGDRPVEAGSKITIGEFSLQLQGIFSLANLETKYETKFLGLLQKTLTKSAIPARISNMGNPISDLHKYIPPSRQLIEIGACPNDCCTFTSPQGNKCPECNTHRYASKNSKVNAKSIFYRSLTGTLIQLLHYPLFMRLMSYSYIKPSKHRVYQKMDVMDGQNAQNHIRSMRKRYQKKFMESPDKPIEVNILVSLFYDGIQLFRKKQENYWPLFCTILNLPPSVRTKVGAGMFMLTAFYGKLDSATEEFIFNDCLIAELKILYKGLLVEVAGRQYFMQVIHSIQRYHQFIMQRFYVCNVFRCGASLMSGTRRL